MISTNSSILTGGFAVALRIAYESDCPPEGHCQEPFRLLDEAIDYALEVAETDFDWVPWGIHNEGECLWKSDRLWSRQTVIDSLRSLKAQYE